MPRKSNLTLPSDKQQTSALPREGLLFFSGILPDAQLISH